MESTISYTINGKVSTEETDWLNWVDDAYRICELLNVVPNECHIGSEKGNYIRSVKYLKNKISRLYERGDSIHALSLFVLPDNYRSIIFDFVVTISRDITRVGYVTVILHRKYQDQYADSVDEELLMRILKNNISMDYGEIYEMDITECPELYAGKVNPTDNFKTLHVIKAL